MAERKRSALSHVANSPATSINASPRKRARSDNQRQRQPTASPPPPPPSSSFQIDGACLQTHLQAPTARQPTSAHLQFTGADSAQQKLNSTPVNAPTAFTPTRPASYTSTGHSPPPPHPSSILLCPQADSVTTAIGSQPLPLTAKNLQKLNGKEDMAPPMTPSSSTKSKSTGPGLLNTQKSTNPQGIRLVMKANGIPIEDQVAIKKFPNLRDYAKDIVDRARDSPMSLEQQQRVQDVRNRNAIRNESTWINKFWPALINTERNVQRRDEDGSPLDHGLWEAVAWEKSFLDSNWDCDLRTDSVPKLETNDPNVQLLLDSLPRITNPRPDIAFGLAPEAFSEEEDVINDRYQMYAQVSQGIYHPWLLVETKTTSGTIEDVENQCCRGGAAFVAAARTMIHGADPDAARSRRGADFQSIAFSVALVPTLANIFCHWAEVKSPEEVVYHMHIIKSYAIRDMDSATALHHSVDNILDWGVGDRKRNMQEVLRKIAERNAGTGKRKRKNAANEEEGGEGEEEL